MRIKQLSVLMILLLSVITPTLLQVFNFEANPGNQINDINSTENLKSYKEDSTPRLSLLGDDAWWDSSFNARMIINVTNPYPYDFEDYGVSVVFDYTSLTSIIQPNLNDIRIVENGILRDHYVRKDYPTIGLATVWFNTNINDTVPGDDIETDTYMYFGNDNAVNVEADDPSESFGWIKNGDFELDLNYSQYLDPWGWTFSHDPIDSIHGEANPGVTDENPYGIEFCNGLLNKSTASEAERVYQGNNAYKFGANRDVLGFSDVYNSYAGAFFSYPFTVPRVYGAGIALHLYRNPRTWGFLTQPTIDDDGYYIRLCDNYGPDPDTHTDIGVGYENYLEIWGGRAFYTGSPNKPGNWQHATKVRNWAKSVTMDTNSESSGDGDLTAPIDFNVSKFEGDTIFLEFGVWGTENNYRSGFFQLDDVRFNYTEISTDLNQLQYNNSTLTIIARDVDGRIVPNAEVMLVDSTLPKGAPGYQIAKDFTNSFGRVTFNDLENRRYNITANYTLGSREREVFNSFDSGSGPYYFNGIFYTEELVLDLWTIDFEIVDWDGIPLSLGYIEVNETGGDLLQTLTLNENGWARFRWLNTSDYSFRVYYDNPDYRNNPLLLNESIVYRKNYDRTGFKYQEQSIWVNNTNTDPPGANSYSISEYIYTNGSRSEIGNTKITKVNIFLTNMIDQLEDISIYYIDKENTTGTSNHLIYFEDGYGAGEDSDTIELDIPLIENTKLKSEKFEVYGLYIEVNGLNFSQCNGIIRIDTVETCNIYNRTHLARINIQTVDEFSNPISSVIRVSDPTTSLIVLSASSSTTNGYAYDGSDYPFWYLKDRTYNFTIDAYNLTNVEFDVQDIDPPQFKPQGIYWFNFTLERSSTITFTVYLPGINVSNYLTSFSNGIGTGNAYWGEDITFSVIFEYTEDNGENWYPVIDPTARCSLFISEVGEEIDLIIENMEPGTGLGNFSITINSNRLSAGGSSKFYNVRIEGSLPGYPDPSIQGFLLKITSIPTTISAHDYDTQAEIPSKLYTAYYDELVNILIQYSIEETGFALNHSQLTYTWLGLAPIHFIEDPINPGFYTFTLNTSDAQSTGLKVISITASYENYTTQSNFLVYLDILERKTTLNEQTEDVYYIRPGNVWIEDSWVKYFTYKDENTGKILGDLSTATFIWEKLYDNGTKIEGAFGSGVLIGLTNKTYVLDFNTELRPAGNYFLFVTLKKDNYEEKNVIISLKIVLRTFSVTFTSPVIGATNQISVDQGATIDFSISLRDLSRDIDLQGATVKIYYGYTNMNITISETAPGVYTHQFETSDIDTFIATETFSVIIYINADNFSSRVIRIVITVNMEELFPGMPTFYFILIMSSVLGVVIAVVGYRVIQRARIPKHIKKIRKIKSLIKSEKKIPEIFSIPDKKMMMANLFGDDWKEINLSIDAVLESEDLTSEKSPIKEPITKERGENK